MARHLLFSLQMVEARHSRSDPAAEAGVILCLPTRPGKGHPLEKTIKLTTEYIKLDALLKVAGQAGSGGEAKTKIRRGEVSLNGTPVTQRGKKIRPGDIVEVAGEPGSRIVIQ